MRKEENDRGEGVEYHDNVEKNVYDRRTSQRRFGRISGTYAGEGKGFENRRFETITTSRPKATLLLLPRVMQMIRHCAD